MIRTCWNLFLMGLWLGGTVFGGVAMAYPIIRAKAEEHRWMAGDEVDALYGLSVFLPGPSFMNLWGAVAIRAGGLPGAAAAQAGLLLPAFVLVLSLPLLSGVELIGSRTPGAMVGTVYGTAGLLIAAGIQALARLRSGARLGAGAAAGVLLLGAHPLLVLIASMALSAGVHLASVRKEAA